MTRRSTKFIAVSCEIIFDLSQMTYLSNWGKISDELFFSGYCKISLLKNNVLSAVGFEPTPSFEDHPLGWRLRPLGHADIVVERERSESKFDNVDIVIN